MNNTHEDHPGPLGGTTVIDCTTMVAGPLATQILADQGANVIKIEPVGGDLARMIGPIFEPGISGSYINLGRNKRSIVLDLAKPEAQTLIHKMVAEADVFVCNSRPGVMAKHQLDYDFLKAINPKLVYASITGFGETGPMSGQRAYDPILQAQSGIAAMSLANAPDQAPQLQPQLICDKLTGLYTAQGVSAALLKAARTGKGDKVEVSLLSSALAFLATDVYWPIASPERELEITDTSEVYKPWQTADGYIVLIVLSDKEFIDLCEIFELGNLMADKRFENMIERLKNWQALKQIIAPKVAQLTSQQALQKLWQASIPAGPVNTVEDLLQDPQVQATGAATVAEHPSAGKYLQIAAAAKFSQPTPEHQHPAHIGQHSREILQQLGYSDAELEGFFQQGIAY